MRRVLHSDVVALARSLLAQPVEQRQSLSRRMIRRAELADIWRRRTGKPHPLWGTGTLESAVAGLPKRGEPYLDDADYAACMAEVFSALTAPSRPNSQVRSAGHE